MEIVFPTALISILLSFLTFVAIASSEKSEQQWQFRSCMMAAGERSVESYEYCLSRFDRMLVITPEQLEQSGFKAE